MPFALSHFFIAASEDAQEEPVIASPRATVAAGQSFLMSLSLRPIPQRQKCTSLYIFALRVFCGTKNSAVLTGCQWFHAVSSFSQGKTRSNQMYMDVYLVAMASMPLLKMYILIQNCIFRNDRIVATHIGKRTAQFGAGIRSSLLRGDIRTLLVVYGILFYRTNFKQIAADCFLSKLCSNCCVAFTDCPPK